MMTWQRCLNEPNAAVHAVRCCRLRQSGVTQGSRRIWQRNELAVVEVRQFRAIAAPVGLGLLDAHFARRHEVPVDQTRADRLATWLHQDRVGNCAYQGRLSGGKHQHTTRFQSLTTGLDRSLDDVYGAFRVLLGQCHAGAGFEHVRDPGGLAVLALVTTIVPGTVWSGLAADRSRPLLHVWDVSDQREFVRRFKTRYEQPLREIFE